MSSPFLLLRNEQGEFRCVDFEGDRLVLGRDPACSLRLTDPSASRRHAVILRRGPRLVLQDQGSWLGTLLNGTPISGPSMLEDGDWIRVGRCLLLVRDHRPAREDERLLEELAAHEGRHPEPSEAGEPELDDTRVLLALPSLVVPSDETASAPQLALLTEVSRTLQSVTQLDEILTVLLGIAFDLVGPERGTVLLGDGRDDALRPGIRHPEDGDDFVSQTILRHAIARRSTLVVSDVEQDERFRGAASLETQSIRAVVCCPLISRDELVGAMYLDTRLGGLNSRREEIGLLNLIACYAATAIENALLLRDRSRARRLADLDEEPLVMQSAAMQTLVRQLDERAGGSDPLLIEGEPGTGKLLAARHLHLAGRGHAAPFLALDCERLSARDLRTILFGAEDAKGPARSAPSRGPGGAWQETSGGTLVLEHVGALDLLAQGVLADLLEETRPSSAAAPPRLVVTTSRKLSELVAKNGFSSRLAELLARDSLLVPRLRDRREDILILAGHFLRQMSLERGGAEKILGDSAEATLAAAKYREANVHELRGAVELAAVLNEGPTIEAEHVFTGPRAREHRLEFDLGSGALVRWALNRHAHEFLHLMATGIFVALSVMCLVWPDRGVGRVANGVVWGLWWPVLIFLFLAVGRVWCTYCPLSRLARWTQSLWSLGRRPPAWIKDRASWIMAALFVVIVWSEHVFDMPHRPLATGIFLVSLLFVAVAVASVTQREVWCRFACPLGNLSACYSVPATVHVHANPMICTSQCKTHECFKGSQEERGCPMFLHPLYLRDAHFCKLCLACVRSCPNGSARLWLRPPLLDVWSLGELNPALAPLAMVTFLLAPLVLAGGLGLRRLDEPVVFTACLLALVSCAVLLHRWLPGWMSRERDPMPATRVTFALLILAWGPLMAFHLGNVPGLGTLRVRSAADGALASMWPSSGLALLPALQLSAIVVAALATAVVLWRLRVRAAERPNDSPARGWWALNVVTVIYVAIAAGMVV